MKNTGNKNGFGIVELLVAMAITSILLVAVAVAFHASMMSYRENEDLFLAVNRARQSLFRITTQLRTGYWVDPNAPNNECSFFTADGSDITYRFNTTDNKLYLITNDITTDSDYVLCDNVSAMTFGKTTRTVEGMTSVVSVNISMTVEVGNAQRTLTSAAVIRRDFSFSN
ncbi:MAG: prepilin-type N-terminal cleavage/methylation domain-containing protein [Phycisphaerae bacterium]|nr:prepilin-type N-terminal cleavage/methylation domain-containing protein [Phycisphaerae bacterium]NIP50426.1 prepilin-type N-terminal cleavage/methylation domain-containing protein [Phycisphaerae bacterium]NIS49554.1 prepilin-type N-terminal cleavage/methylation domain-containing protein [Phycisphaerae bacterium]NIU07312.1 prepilin-type N-terminal cleavage/methylation domain-containing protein [Phycisphaerae bacterium]NIU54881.1 prepilin-type N-terminal cleavage/methylation domain-containing 